LTTPRDNESRIGYAVTDTMSSKFANLDPTQETEQYWICQSEIIAFS